LRRQRASGQRAEGKPLLERRGFKVENKLFVFLLKRRGLFTKRQGKVRVVKFFIQIYLKIDDCAKLVRIAIN
jgi:hypothetical protein